jgi:hypothetical protein
MTPGKRYPKKRARVAAVIGAAVLAAAVLFIATPAQADPSRPATAELVPAFDHDLPTGKATLGPVADGTLRTAADWICTVYASDPSKDGTTLSGEGWQQCSGSGYQPISLKLAIQKYRGFGLWANLSSYQTPYYYTDWIDITTYTSCAGQGTQTYRVVSTGYAENGAASQAVQSLNYLRVYC